jgi:hypothetical protein
MKQLKDNILLYYSGIPVIGILGIKREMLKLNREDSTEVRLWIRELSETFN